MKPRIYKVKEGDYLYMYHNVLPWNLEMDGFNCLCNSFELAIKTLEKFLKAGVSNA